MILSAFYQEIVRDFQTANRSVGEINLITYKYHQLTLAQVLSGTIDGQVLVDDKFEEIKQLVNQYLSANQPLAYLIGIELFDDLVINVSPDVLIPRQETLEVVLNLEAKIRTHFPKKSNLKLLDLCTGSGVIGLWLVKKLQADYQIELTISDLSVAALEVAKLNFAKYQIPIKVLSGDLLAPAIAESCQFDIVVANPPYVSLDEYVEASVLDFEPHLALFAINQGLSCYEKIISELKYVIKYNGLICFEIGANQAQAILKMMRQHLKLDGEIGIDINGRDRSIIWEYR